MTTPYSPAPQPIREAPSAEPAADPNTLIAMLPSIGAGVAANGQPWPERHQLRGGEVARLYSLKSGDSHGYHIQAPPSALEEGQNRGPEGAAQAPGPQQWRYLLVGEKF